MEFEDNVSSNANILVVPALEPIDAERPITAPQSERSIVVVQPILTPQAERSIVQLGVQQLHYFF